MPAELPSPPGLAYLPRSRLLPRLGRVRRQDGAGAAGAPGSEPGDQRLPGRPAEESEVDAGDDEEKGIEGEMSLHILIACEESQEVCKAFRTRGYEAYSCDIQEPSGGHPEWHILADVLEAIQGGQVTTMDGQTHEVGRWDLIIAFPPCTKTSNAGARHLYKGGRLNIKRYYEGLCGKALFLAIWAADCEKVVIENPTPSKVFGYPEPTQVIQPYQYGHPFTKKTLLWERGVKPLKPTDIVEPTATWCPSGSYSYKHGAKHKGMFTTDRAKNRAKTFPGIAKAMAEQWGDAILESNIGGKPC